MVRLLRVILFTLPILDVCAQPGDSAVVHTMFLLGDAGEPHVKDTPMGKIVSEKIAQAGDTPTVLFLGDNIYTRGLPDEDARNYEEAESILKTQVEFVQGFKAKGIFIPGNHDWHNWGRKGLEYIRNQQRWLDSLRDENITLLPRDGCPGPVEISLGEKAVLIILDTQWFLHQWDKATDPELCSATTPAEVFSMVEDIFRRNRGKRMIVAAHHPLYTYGEHGGVFTWKAHIFPLVKITRHAYFPFPAIGSVYPLYRKWLGHIQDTPHPLYRSFSEALQLIMRAYPGAIYVAGHEHALQYIVKDSTHYVVSGSAAKTEYVKQKGHAVFAKDILGFAELGILANGSVRLTFHQVDARHPDGHNVFQTTIPPVSQEPSRSEEAVDFRGQVARTKASGQYEGGTFYEKLLGENYRAAWSQKIEVPVFDFGRDKGGLRILKRGEGLQTLSLRLADSSGREYVLRSVEKYPEAAVPEVLRKTFAQSPVQDRLSASHPYAALAVAPLAEAVGLFHTHPRLVYIPDDHRLGEYRSTFAHMLALFEERPALEGAHAPWFGNAENVVSTAKVIENLVGDNDNRVDEKFVLKNRLFDFITGDWDRHDDQWRWAKFKEEDDVYRPIPRHRDQAFFVNEGLLARLWSRRWALPSFEGFQKEIRWPPGLSFNARHFDRTFLTSLSREEWVETAETLKNGLTDAVIEDALRQWPDEIFDLDGRQVIEKLKSRRDKIVSYALSHYAFLAREVNVTGSDKKEAFVVERLPGGDVDVRVYKMNRKGEREKMLYERTFRKNETREIRLFGLDGEDVFEISGSAGSSIRIRVIGGTGEDLLLDQSTVSGPGRKTWFYDQPGQGQYRSAGEVRDLRSPDPAVNKYDRLSFEYDRLAPLFYGHYSPDDGVFAGAGFTFTKHGFRKEPFRQRHTFLASVAPLTRSYHFSYQGEFTDVIGKWDVEFDADLMPNFVSNFFGMGNASVYDEDIGNDVQGDFSHAIQYYRYRFKEVWIQPSFSRELGRWGTLKFGPAFQRVELRPPHAGRPRYIETYAMKVQQPLFEVNHSFAGASWDYTVGRRDNALFTRRGSVFSMRGRHLSRMEVPKSRFSAYHGSFSLFHSFRENSPLVLASRVGGGINSGRYPFYQAQILDGQTSLRGFRKTRFYGDRQLYANVEVRLKLFSFRSYLLPTSMGMLGFYDVGRIWYKNDDLSATGGTSDVWHKGWGGGLWFTPFNRAVLSAEIAHSNEGTLGYARLGFLF